MKSIYYYIKLILAVVFATILFNGCKKLVNIQPPVNSISTAAAFGTDAKVNSVMAGLYNQLINQDVSFSNGQTTLFGALSADEVVDYGGAANPVNYPLLTNNINANTDIVTSNIWITAYKAIYNANGAVENLTSAVSAKVSDSLRTHSEGEAKFIRAFSYFYLTNFYGDVPLVLSTNFNITATLAKSPQVKVYEQIVQDLKDAQTLLPANFAAGQDSTLRIRANKAAATALLARVYLYQKNWKDAETQANSVILNHQYSLPTDLSTVFLKNSQEVIWQLKQDISLGTPANATNDGVNFSTLNQWENFPPDVQAAYLDSATYSQLNLLFLPKNYLTDELSAAFEAGDKRWAAWVRSTPSPAMAPYNGTVYNYPFKYTLAIGTSGQLASQYYVVLRLAEQYLIRAEARAQQGNISGAAADINVIRARAGLPNITGGTQADVLNAVAQERRIEFFAEWGHRWFDLKRTGKATDVLGAIKIKQPWKPNQLLYPIPVSEIVKDPKLVQNPGY